LAVAGVTLLGIATAVSIRNKFFPHKPKMEEVTPQPVAPSNESAATVEDDIHQDLHLDEPHSYDVSARQKHIGDTEKIVYQLAGGSHRREREILGNHQHVADAEVSAEEPANLREDRFPDSQPQPAAEVEGQAESSIPSVLDGVAKKSK
jgi:hypothetical protein